MTEQTKQYPHTVRTLIEALRYCDPQETREVMLITPDGLRHIEEVSFGVEGVVVIRAYDEDLPTDVDTQQV